MDQGYRTRLENLEVAPPAHAWAAIAAQLPNESDKEKGAWWWLSGASAAYTPEEKSKRERIIFYWCTGALLALASMSLFAYYGLDSTGVASNPTPTPPSSVTAALLPMAAANTNTASAEGINLTTTTEEDCPEISTNTAAIALTTSTSTFKGVQAKSTTPNTSSTALNSIVDVDRNALRSDVTVRQTTTTTITAPLSESTLLTDTKTTTPPTSTNLVGLSMATVTLNKLPLTGLSELESGATKLPFGPGIGCEDFKSRAGWSFAVRLFGGPGTIFQEYTSTTTTAAYATLRDSIENKQLSVHAGLRFEAVNDLGLFLRAGADYQMYRSNVKDIGSPRTRTIIDSVFMEDTQTWRVETRNEVFQQERNVYNRHHTIALTAGVGFRKTFGNVSPYIMAEGGYELRIKSKGDFVLPDGNFVDLADDDQGLYTNDRPGFQYGGVLGVDFALTDRIEVGVSAHYKQLGGLRGSADLLDYKQSTAFGALNLRYTIR